jgi:hypothetical protein
MQVTLYSEAQNKGTVNSLPDHHRQRRACGKRAKAPA